MEARPSMELDMRAPATFVGELSFGNGKIGLNPKLETLDEKQEYGQELGAHTGEITFGFEEVSLCVEDRPWTMVGDITDPDELVKLTVYQTAGGDVYSAFFALMATRSHLLDDQKDINSKAKGTAFFLQSLGFGLHVHEGCGLAASVSTTGNHIVSVEEAAEAFGVFGPVSDEDRAGLTSIVDNLTEMANSTGQPDSFSDFEPEGLEEYIRSQDHGPKYYAKIAVDLSDNETKGHKAEGLYLPANGGFVKNQFVQDTGKMAFAYTDEFAEHLSRSLSPHDPTQARLLHLAIRYHQLIAAKALFAPDMPVFKQESTPLAA